jgi:Ala-tRNA(Pro) deacylase
MPLQKLTDFLDREGVKYVRIMHSPAFTMSEIAHQAHICGKEVAKTVMVRLDDQLVMAVVPSSSKVDVETLRSLTGADTVTLATEKEFEDYFPGCETGAMPPFGNLYGMEVYVAPELAEREQIAFNAGSHTELIRLAYADFERLVRPEVTAFAATV